MIEKTFYSPNGKEILIQIDSEAISFFDSKLIRHNERWLEDQRLSGHEPHEEEYKVHEFYWIGKGDWISDKTNRLDREDNWQKHMIHKNWFTKEMKQFIDENT
jgi:hypothetical protein